MHQAENTTLAEEDVVIELFGKVFPEFERVFVDRGALVPEVVGADDRGVAGHVAACKPAALEHRNVGDAVVFRKVIRRGETMAAGAHDDDLVRAPRLRVAPEMIGMRMRLRHAHCWLLYIRLWSSRIQSGGGAGSGPATWPSTTSIWPSALRSRSISSKPCSPCGRRNAFSICPAARAGTRSSWPAAVMTSPAPTCRPTCSAWPRNAGGRVASGYAGSPRTC